MKYLDKLIQNEEIKHLLNTIFDGVYIVDKERTIKFWNHGAEKITGFKEQEVLNKKCANNILNHIDEHGRLLCKSNCPLVVAMNADTNITEKVYPLNNERIRFPTQTAVSPIKNELGEVVGAIEVFRDITKEEDYRLLQEKFDRLIQKYVSLSTYKEVKNQLNPKGAHKNTERELTILYLDVVNFTAFSENLNPAEVAEMLNDLFGICDVITRETHGDIDKFIGDAIMATFIDANDAVAAAILIKKALKQFNGNRLIEGKPAMSLRFGINTGKVMQVEVGTSERKDFTVIGDAVNTASRIESLGAPNNILISESTYLLLKSKKEFSFFGKKMLKGKEKQIVIYEYCDNG